MSRLIEKTTLVQITSFNRRHDETIENFTFYFPRTLRRVSKFRIISYAIPNSMYNISDYFNNRKVKFIIDGTTYEYDLEEGYYLGEDAADALQTLLNQSIDGFTVTLDPNSKKITIEHSTHDFTIVYDPNYLTNEFFGYYSNQVSASKKVKFSYPVAPIVTQEIQLRANIVKNSIEHQTESSDLLYSFSLAGSSYGDLIQATSSLDGIYYEPNSHDISIIHLKLTDSYGRPVGLNEYDYSITLEFTYFDERV